MIEFKYSPAAEIKKNTGRTSSREASWAERHPKLTRAAKALKARTPRSRAAQKTASAAQRQLLRDAYAPEHMLAGLPKDPMGRAAKLREMRAKAGT